MYKFYLKFIAYSRKISYRFLESIELLLRLLIKVPGSRRFKA